jgi:hypothetical protein
MNHSNSKISIALAMVVVAVAGTMAVMPTEKAFADMKFPSHKERSQSCNGSSLCIQVAPSVVVGFGPPNVAQNNDQTCKDQGQCAQQAQQSDSGKNKIGGVDFGKVNLFG